MVPDRFWQISSFWALEKHKRHRTPYSYGIFGQSVGERASIADKIQRVYVKVTRIDFMTKTRPESALDYRY